MLNLISCVA